MKNELPDAFIACSVITTVSPEKVESATVFLSQAEPLLDCCAPVNELNKVSLPPGILAYTFNPPMLLPYMWYQNENSGLSNCPRKTGGNSILAVSDVALFALAKK